LQVLLTRDFGATKLTLGRVELAFQVPCAAGVPQLFDEMPDSAEG
jgi:hypothetical protein